MGEYGFARNDMALAPKKGYDFHPQPPEYPIPSSPLLKDVPTPPTIRSDFHPRWPTGTSPVVKVSPIVPLNPASCHESSLLFAAASAAPPSHSREFAPGNRPHVHRRHPRPNGQSHRRHHQNRPHRGRAGFRRERGAVGSPDLRRQDYRALHQCWYSRNSHTWWGNGR